MMTRQTVTMSAVSVLLASLALAGCDRRDETQTARSGDTAVVQGQPTVGDQAARSADQAGEATKQAANDATNAARNAATDVANASKNAADQASNKVSDAVITTSVNAELAKDPQLSSLRIDVDTDAGRVALKGTAPDAASKQRATQLASSVKGVVSVDNQLQVGKG
jgi:hyperosmotically inducible protein